jgi:hypothetical protein
LAVSDPGGDSCARGVGRIMSAAMRLGLSLPLMAMVVAIAVIGPLVAPVVRTLSRYVGRGEDPRLAKVRQFQDLRGVW